MSRSTSRKSGIGLGRRIRSALLAQKQYWKMYFAMKLRRLRVPAPLVLLGGSLLGFFMLTLLMLSVVAIDVISTLLLLCRKLLGRGQSEGALLCRAADVEKKRRRRLRLRSTQINAWRLYGASA